jgi:hypothetical protein
MIPEAKRQVTRLDYCQFLLSSQINYTQTHFADHAEQFSHDAINRYMAAAFSYAIAVACFAGQR